MQNLWGEENASENPPSPNFLDPSKKTSGLLCCESVVQEKPAKSKRGREEGDGTENVINCRDVCRKLS